MIYGGKNIITHCSAQIGGIATAHLRASIYQ